MAHKFHKTAFNTIGMPSRIGDWSKLQKRAHHIWSIDTDNAELVATRKNADPVELNYAAAEEPAFSVGDVVVLLLGGQRTAARVVALDERTAKLVTKSGQTIDIDIEGE